MQRLQGWSRSVWLDETQAPNIDRSGFSTKLGVDSCKARLDSNSRPDTGAQLAGFNFLNPLIWVVGSSSAGAATSDW
jgi:hypothetical protein